LCYIINENQYCVNYSYLKFKSKTVGHCHTDIEQRNLYNERKCLYPMNEQNFQ